MRAARSVRGWVVLVIALSCMATALAPAQEPKAYPSAIRQDRVVAGGPSDFMEARHLVLQGTNEAIGQALAETARERFHTRAPTSPDPLRTRAQRHYLERNDPILVERMRGVAAAFGGRLDDDSKNFSGLFYPPLHPPGCSVVYYPPAVTASGAGIISRNYDFTTGTYRGTKPKPAEMACTARPYVIEMYPDRGYPSLAICSYDLLSGVLDGVNSEGLTVALLADDESGSKMSEPARSDVAGLGVLQTLRLLLDTCANVDDAKEALLSTKQYYEIMPVHYLVADRHGKAFLWELSRTRNREFIFENPGKPLVITNFTLHRHLDGKELPSGASAKAVCPRYCALCEGIAKHEGKVSPEFIKENHKAADAVAPGRPASGRMPGRTLWHALYFPDERKVQVSFYLRDEPDADNPAKPRIVRSDYLEFALQAPSADRK
jgi:hypothetical protein